MGRIVSTVQVLRGGRCSVGSDDVFCAYDAIHGVRACVRRCVRTDRITPCLIHSALSPSASPNDIETEY